jgi:hypothetical protein
VPIPVTSKRASCGPISAGTIPAASRKSAGMGVKAL